MLPYIEHAPVPEAVTVAFVAFAVMRVARIALPAAVFVLNEREERYAAQVGRPEIGWSNVA